MSIPFFSVGRRVHSRTLSVASVGTPDWLLWTRRTNTMSAGSNVHMEVDLESPAVQPHSDAEQPHEDVAKAEVKVSTPRGEVVADEEMKVVGPSSILQRRILDAEGVRHSQLVSLSQS